MEIHLDAMRYVHHKGAFYKQKHSHDLCEFAYYVSGAGNLWHDGRNFEYSKGTIRIVEAGVSHDENNRDESRIILLYFDIPKGFIPSGIYNDRSGTILTLLRQLRFEMQENLMYKQEMIDSFLLQILLLLKRKLFPQPSENPGFNHIVRYIDENFQSDIDIHSVASKAFYSYDRFRHVFKEHTGFSPQEYIINKRIDLAKFLIDTDPDISLTALSSECGFKGLSQFSNSFKSKLGLTASEYKLSKKRKTN